MLFGNADIVIAIRKFLGKFHQPRAFTHRRGDGHQAYILRRHVANPLRKNLGVRRAAGTAGTDFVASFRIKASHTMEQTGIVFSGLKAFAFFGDDMQQARPAMGFKIAQHGDQGGYVMAIDRAVIAKTQLFKQSAGHDHALYVFFGTLCQLPHIGKG